MRSNGTLVDDSATAFSRRATQGTRLTFCQLLLSQVPERLETLNKGLRTLHFYQIDYSPFDFDTIVGGTQDNGSWESGDGPGSGTNSGPNGALRLLGSASPPTSSRARPSVSARGVTTTMRTRQRGRWRQRLGEHEHRRRRPQRLRPRRPCFRLSGFQQGQTMVSYDPKNQLDMNWTSDTHFVFYGNEANAFIGTANDDTRSRTALVGSRARVPLGQPGPQPGHDEADAPQALQRLVRRRGRGQERHVRAAEGHLRRLDAARRSAARTRTSDCTAAVRNDEGRRLRQRRRAGLGRPDAVGGDAVRPRPRLEERRRPRGRGDVRPDRRRRYCGRGTPTGSCPRSTSTRRTRTTPGSRTAASTRRTRSTVTCSRSATCRVRRRSRCWTATSRVIASATSGHVHRGQRRWHGLRRHGLRLRGDQGQRRVA